MPPDPFCIAYHSRSLLPREVEARHAALRHILDRARRNNEADGIGGALMVTRDSFVQVLEGPQRAVQRTFDRIVADERHADLVVLHMGFVPSPRFVGWSMGLVTDASLEADGVGPVPASDVDALPVTTDKLLGFLLDLVLREVGRSPTRRMVG